jgi:hypothetical protein
MTKNGSKFSGACATKGNQWRIALQPKTPSSPKTNGQAALGE